MHDNACETVACPSGASPHLFEWGTPPDITDLDMSLCTGRDHAVKSNANAFINSVDPTFPPKVFVPEDDCKIWQSPSLLFEIPKFIWDPRHTLDNRKLHFIKCPTCLGHLKIKDYRERKAVDVDFTVDVYFARYSCVDRKEWNCSSSISSISPEFFAANPALLWETFPFEDSGKLLYSKKLLRHVHNSIMCKSVFSAGRTAKQRRFDRYMDLVSAFIYLFFHTLL